MKDKLLSYLSGFWDWVKNLIPWAIAVTVWQYFTRKIWKSERTVEQKELEIAHHENKQKIKKLHRNRSNADLVRDAIREGREIRERDDSDNESRDS